MVPTGNLAAISRFSSATSSAHSIGQHFAHVVTPLAVGDHLFTRSIDPPCLGVTGRWSRILLRARAIRMTFSRDRLRLRGLGAIQAGRICGNSSAPSGVVR